MAATSAHASVIKWSGGINGTGTSWSQAANWDGGVIPGSTNDAVFDNRTGGGTLPSNLSVSGNRNFRTLTFDNVNGVFPTTLNIDTNGTGGSTARTLTLDGDGTRSITLAANLATTIVFRGNNGDLNVSLPSVREFQVLNAGGNLNFQSAVPITGSGGYIKTGPGTMAIGTSSTFSGGATLREGTLRTFGSSSESGGTVTQGPFGTGTLTLEGGNLQSSSSVGRTYHNSIVLDGNIAFGTSAGNGSGEQTISSLAGTTTIAGDSTLNVIADVTWFQTMTGSFGITKEGAGALSVTSNSTFSGGVTVREGVYRTLGSSSQSGGVITSGSFGTGTVTLEGGTVASSSSVDRVYFNSVILGGNVTLGEAATGSQTFSATTGGTTTLTGARQLNVITETIWGQDIGGDFRLTKTGGEALTLDGSNSFNSLTILQGTVAVAGASTLPALPGSVQADHFLLDGGTLRFRTSFATVPLSANRGIALGGNDGTIEVDAGQTVLTNADLTDAGVDPGSLIKTGGGTLGFTALSDSTYTGNTFVNAGTLVVDGTLAAGSLVDVAGGATLRGSGVVPDVLVKAGGNLHPGSLDARGSLGLNDLEMEALSQLVFALDSAVSFDSIVATGTVTLETGLDAPELVLTLNFQPVANMDVFVLLDNQGAEAISGRLSYGGLLLQEGDTFLVTNGSFSQLFQITYQFGGDSIAVFAIPEPGGAGLLLIAGAGALLLRRLRRR